MSTPGQRETKKSARKTPTRNRIGRLTRGLWGRAAYRADPAGVNFIMWGGKKENIGVPAVMDIYLRRAGAGGKKENK